MALRRIFLPNPPTLHQVFAKKCQTNGEEYISPFYIIVNAGEKSFTALASEAAAKIQEIKKSCIDLFTTWIFTIKLFTAVINTSVFIS